MSFLHFQVETIQKQIEKPSGNRRGLFGFGKAKKTDLNKNEFLQDQLNELTEKLHKLDTDLSHVENDKYLEVFDVNQNRNNYPNNGFTNHRVTASDKHVDSDDENGRTKTIKSAVQKWTNKTFSSVKKKHTSNGKLNGTDSMPDICGTYNGETEVTLNGEHHNENDVTDEFNRNESSVTDLTRPLDKLSLSLPLSSSLNANYTSGGSWSPTSARNFRTGSNASTVSSVSSPRREINPSVLAEIDVSAR